MSGIGNFFNDIGNGVEWWWKNVGAGGIRKGYEEGKDSGSATGDAINNTINATPVVGPTLERTMAGMRWLRDNAVSQPISTAMLVGRQGGILSSTANPFLNPGGFATGQWFDSGTWSRSWKAANHISPGQAAFMSPKDSEDALNSPLLYYKPASAYLPPGFDNLPEEQQQQILKDAGMPAIGNAFVEKARQNSAWYRYGTGTVDLGLAMFADPTAHGLGAVSKVAKARNLAKAPAGGWSAAEIDNIMNTSKVKALMDGIWRNKDNPQLLNNTKLAQHSGMGPRFGALVSTLQDPEELGLFVRSGMGDKGALDELRSRNALADQRLKTMDARLTSLGLMRNRYHNFPNIQAMIDQHIDQVETAYNTDVAMVNRYQDIINNQGMLDQLYVGRQGGRAAQLTQEQNKYVTGPGRGFVVDNQGIQHHRIFGQGGYFAGPVTVIRMLQNAHPNGYMRIDTIDKDSLAELRGHLSRIPGITPDRRSQIMNDYLKTTTEHERKDLLESVGRLGSRMIAQKHGVSTNIADELYKQYVQKKFGAIESIKQRYTGATDPERVNAAGQPMHLDELMDNGGKTALTPFTATRLMNGHTFQDLDVLDKVLARHGSKLETLRLGLGNAKDALEQGAEYVNYMWKFATLFRLGYIPRVLGDDLGSQWAAAGTAAMALRGVRGVYNAFDNAARWVAKPALQAREANAMAGSQYATDEMNILRPQIIKMQRQLFADVQQRARDVTTAYKRHQTAQTRLAQLDPADLSPKANAVRQFANQRAAQLKAAQLRHQAGVSPGKSAALNDMLDRHDMLSRYRDLQDRAAAEYNASYQKVIQGSQHVMIDGRPFPAAFDGRSGQYALAQISADESVGNLFASNKQLIRGNLERSFNHGGKPISAAQDPAEHLQAWAHAINNQIMQDPMSKLAVKGWTIDEIVHWLQRDPQGIAYRARLPKNIPDEEFARSAKYEVDQYLHIPEVRMKALEGEVPPSFLAKAAPEIADRPDVHTGEIGLSQLQHANALDRVVQKWYGVAATLPANRMSRHPLFNSFYEGHLKRMTNQWVKQAGRPVHAMPVSQVEQLAHSARQLALRDTRSLVFDIAHRSDAAAAVRFMSPFFSATAEAFQRWGRVLADKPQIAGFAANWYNSPAYLGAVQDLDGNKVDEFGNTYIPQYPLKADGTPDYSRKPTIIKRRVPKGERYIITRLPKWVVHSPLGAVLNVQESDGRLLLSQNSINMVTQGDPWMNPGVGPIVQMPVNEFVQDKPRAAEIARHLGIMPFGVQGGGSFGDNPVGRAANIFAPQQIKNFITGLDTSDERYQQVKMQILNRTIYEYAQRHGGAMPSASELGKMKIDVADRTRNYWLFQAAAQFVQPFATQRKDPYQFYYDQYNALRRQNPKTADDEFLKRYGESHFIFASEITQSQGIPPTAEAVKLARKYGKEIAAAPELAALIIGPNGSGPFSPEAYRYELNNPLVPGSPEMMRSKMTADQALEENRRRLGWAKYTKKMNQLTADLHKAGFASFNDDGADYFKTQKKAWTSLYAEPLYPDGTPNPYYNEAWSKDFFTQDARKYERMIPALTTIANSSLANQPGRSDLRKLQEYLGGRKSLIQQLNDRRAAGMSYTLGAQDNEDLRLQWASFVDGLIEESPRFGDLYHRYLSNDMGVNAQEVNQ